MNAHALTLAGLRGSNGASTRALTNLSLLPPRLALGGAMLYHGASKLRGEGPAQTGQFFEAVGLKPGEKLARATGWAEVLAGTMAVLGVGTRLAALAVLVTQFFAVQKVHAAKGYDVMQGGYEYNLALMAMSLGLLLRGPGGLSVHEGLERLAEGRGPRRLLRRARPHPLLRALKLVK
jgi:putative oxidoreductase